MKYLILGLAMLPNLFLFGQQHDYIWKIGYSDGTGGNPIDSFGISILDFRNGDSLAIYPDYDLKSYFNYANLSFCDAEGNYLFSSNGTRIYNKLDGWMEGAERLNVNEVNGYILPQGVLALPHPRDSNLYAFFHGRKTGVVVTQTWYSEIDMRENEGLGALTYMQPLIQDSLGFGQFTAVKHGNGRDWWIVFQARCREKENCDQNFFYRVLLSPDGVEILNNPIFRSDLTETGVGQAVFTPDGTKYIASQSALFDAPYYIDIYDVDRCTGWLDNKRTIESLVATRDNSGFGLVVSPNSRFIYLIMSRKIIQYDLEASDVKASETIVAEYDGFVQYGRDGFPLATRFLFGQLAPDGKIYICTSNSTQYLHVIHNPNEKGLACNVEQHGIELPTFNSFSIPNHPSYRLGAWEDSPCDTLSPISSTKQIAYNEVKFFPNPSTGFLQLELDEDVPISQLEVRFYSLVGQQVAIFKGQKEFDLSGFLNGVYLAEVLRNGKIIGREKIILQR